MAATMPCGQELREELDRQLRNISVVASRTESLTSHDAAKAAGLRDALATYSQDATLYHKERLRGALLEALACHKPHAPSPEAQRGDEAQAELANLAKGRAGVAAALATLRNELETARSRSRRLPEDGQRLLHRLDNAPVSGPLKPAEGSSGRAASGEPEATASAAALASRAAELRLEVAAARAAAEQREAELAALVAQEDAAAAEAGESGGSASSGGGSAGELEAAQQEAQEEDERIAARHEGVNAWYDGLAQALEALGGIRLDFNSSATAEQRDGSDSDEDIEEESHRFAVLFGRYRMEIGLRLSDGAIDTVGLQVEPQPQQGGSSGSGGGGGGGGGGDELDVASIEDIVSKARELLPPEDLRFLVRETQQRARCRAELQEHVAKLKKRLVNGKKIAVRHPRIEELYITAGQGITVQLRISRDYPLVPGGARVISLSGVGGWTAEETEAMKQRLNDAAVCRLEELLDLLEREMAGMDSL